jgi:hypothetical protein
MAGLFHRKSRILTVGRKEQSRCAEITASETRLRLLTRSIARLRGNCKSERAVDGVQQIKARHDAEHPGAGLGQLLPGTQSPIDARARGSMTA